MSEKATKNEWIKGTESIHFRSNFAEISHILWLNLSNFMAELQ